MDKTCYGLGVRRAAARGSWDDNTEWTASPLLGDAIGPRQKGEAPQRSLLENVPGRGAAILGLGLILATAAIAQTETFTTSNGHQLELPPVSKLETCAQIQDVMDRIDATNYRPGSPVGIKHPGDQQLLRYEDALSAQSYRKCQQRQPQGFLGGVRMKIK